MPRQTDPVDLRNGLSEDKPTTGQVTCGAHRFFGVCVMCGEDPRGGMLLSKQLLSGVLDSRTGAALLLVTGTPTAMESALLLL